MYGMQIIAFACGAAREGGVQHSSFDNSANAGAYIADWVAETLGGRVAHESAP
jgi:hypothetical protein